MLTNKASTQHRTHHVVSYINRKHKQTILLGSHLHDYKATLKSKTT